MVDDYVLKESIEPIPLRGGGGVWTRHSLKEMDIHNVIYPG